ncbi:MAG: hypothetical protein Sapg2KO_34770 [Saprospiraceae bacterium]
MKSYSLLFTLLIGFLLSAPALEGQMNSETLSKLKLRNIGPANMSGRIVDLAVVEKDPYTIYAASATGGVWKTTNNGITFKPVFQNEATHSVGAIAVHQENPKYVWVGTGERANRQSSGWGDGIYKSSDSGKTWTNVGLKESHHIGRIVLHPQDTNHIYVAAMGHLWGPNEERGLYESKDGGKNWTKILKGDKNTGVVDVAMDPSDPNILYAATYQRRRRPYGFDGGGPGSKLWKSTDAGKTWKELIKGLPEGNKGRIGISIYRTNPNIVYVCVEQGYQYNASTAYGKRKAGIYRSEDKGETWTFMSDWNPRPMYASQILVDPSDDQRIYMMNQYSYSDDGGKTFTPPRQSLHGDDRIFWVNPKDSRHVMKGDDGGLGISYDRGITWLFIKSLPLSQFYRVSVDMQKPYNVIGGLQDNGSWIGPNETYLSDGILNEDWRRTGGGDGFLNLIHPNDPDILYTESQYLGLSKLNLKTGQRQSIRPGDPKGRIGARRNWDAWGPGVPEPELGNAMAPANWDGPFYISAHDANTIYAGTNILWKSSDNGNTWKELGDLTTKTNRRELSIMGQRPDTSTASLDDGIPYWPTLTAVAESPLQRGLLYVGTDDGQVQVSTDDGQTWDNATGRLPSLPKMAWINTIEVSTHDAGTAFVALNNYRNNDFNNYLYKTTNSGKTWTSIVGDLPANRVVRTMRQDPKNPNLLYLATEIGFFISQNGGRNWVELKNNMPTVAFNDMVIHPRDNDLVLATHGRGVWILDNLNALQEWESNKAVQLFSIPRAQMINYTRKGAHVGDMIFRGENPRRGAVIDYYLKDAVAKDDISVNIKTLDGELVRKISADTTMGINRVYWDFNHEAFPSAPRNPKAKEEGASRRWRSRGMSGPMADPGRYIAELEVNGKIYQQSFLIEDDPRVDVDLAVRKAWTKELFKIGDLYGQIVKDMKVVRPLMWKMEALQEEKKTINEAASAEIKELNRMYDELLSRTGSVYRQLGGWMGPMTADQASQLSYYSATRSKLVKRTEKLMDEMIPKWNKKLDKEDRFVSQQ